ncbi:NUDIX domain-containing protein [Agrobacterium larrymoorei]|uniref:8-oxo-dGTP pyrophosphatase MutT (NUDIX family) n=1 Tax=Agrobacterium larrymoorei TaxID=160699 RepID=A0ABU0UMA1_9HYPH|nr:NUDIX domain-containing protein [Agrobacterium larrymoorei]MDQ1186091.1 8-oxo-dGTP pyrophosphatase MutT (NUDIX family) [Agrobacterium larrymoorei]
MEKVCPVVFRETSSGREVLGFIHPSAVKQFVKGTVEKGESLQDAAKRELEEESGLVVGSAMIFLGTSPIGPENVSWHFFAYRGKSLPDSWDHATTDDHSHTFSFFWHPLEQPLSDDWHPVFHQALAFFSPRIRQFCTPL